jgi:hypothetical protein
MASTVSFGDGNRGLQVGQSFAPITAEIHLPPGQLVTKGILCKLSSANDCPAQSDRKHHLARCPPSHSAATETLWSAENYLIRSSKNVLCQGLGLQSSASVVSGEYKEEPDNNR